MKESVIYVLLTFRKEQEHGIYITKEITNEQEIMYPVHQQATEALCSIIRQARKFQDERRKAEHWQGEYQPNDTVGVYGYCHNIIAFSGSRGQGKTSAMLSFSRALENSFQPKIADQAGLLSKCGFTVLPPIDPTVLEQDQSILAVVLSRMYRLAEEAWSFACNRHKFSDDSSAGEAERNILLRFFQQCLSGINNIKFRKGEEIRGLIEMHEISDSAVLKDNFERLTDSLLKFVRRDKDDVTPFLVVQLDDTDFQIRKSYEIMEDIRKYLTIPNMIILMATDLNMLRATLTQHLVRDFYLKMDRENLKGIIDVDKLWKIESKHLDKLIPPTHAICMPHLDSMILQRGEDIHVQYLERDCSGVEQDILLPPDRKTKDGKKIEGKAPSLQESVFLFVYQKTRIVFTSSRTRLHKMLPTTLRGLAQFLAVLSSMRSVPAISSSNEDYNNAQRLSNLVSRQVEILETNLSLFENYFLNDWVHAKLSVKKAGLFDTLTTTEAEKQYWCAIKALQEIYEEDGQGQTSLFTYQHLMTYVQNLEGRFLDPDDMYVFFAVRMFFDFQAHKIIARQKRRAIEEQKRDHSLIIFDFTQCAQNLPDALCLDGTGWEVLIKDLRKDQYNRIIQAVSDKSFARFLLRQNTNTDTYRFDPLYFIPFFLSLGDTAYKNIMRGESSQETLYFVQTTCATVAINRNVQEVVIQALKENPPPTADKYDYWGLLREFFKVINTAIQKINGGPGVTPSMIVSWMGEIPTFMEGGNRSEFRNLLGRLKTELSFDHLQPLCNIYHIAELLFKAASKAESEEDILKVQDIWQKFVEISDPYSSGATENGLDRQIWESYFEPKAGNPRAEANGFWQDFDHEFRKLCKQLGYPISIIKKKVNADNKKRPK